MIKRTPKLNLVFEVKDYPGNYEREFVSYVFGVLDDVQYFEHKPFPYIPSMTEEQLERLDKVGVDTSDLRDLIKNSKAEYEEMEKNYNLKKEKGEAVPCDPHCPEYLKLFWKEVMGIEDFDTSECFLGTNFNAQSYNKKDITPYKPYMDFSKYPTYRIFDDYLEQVFEETDDWDQFTFYNISCWENGKRNNKIIIHLKKELSEELLKQTLERAYNFEKVYEELEAKWKSKIVKNNIKKVYYQKKGEKKEVGLNRKFRGGKLK